MTVNKIIIVFFFLFQTINCSNILANDELLLRFPGELSQITSPNEKYLLINIDSDSKKDSTLLGANHALYLKNLQTEKQRIIYKYDRYIEILWSPLGDNLVINDHGDSNYSKSIIFLFNGKKECIDIKEKLREAEIDKQSIFGNHHVYIEGIKWLSENKILIRISGYGDIDPDGFTLWFEYSIDGKFIKRTE